MSAGTCPACGAPLDEGTSRCHDCRGWCCDVCEEPAYRDESVVYDALGKKHQRCGGDVAQPRPVWMKQRPATRGELALAL
jgi:hypothetical protein